ncbi:hypothetical protein BN1708_020654, partial [Verticillium longisporum]
DGGQVRHVRQARLGRVQRPVPRVEFGDACAYRAGGAALHLGGPGECTCAPDIEAQGTGSPGQGPCRVRDARPQGGR